MLHLTADESPFHHGERMVQQRLGVRDVEQWARQVVRGYLPDQHRDFYASLPFLVTAARDSRGRPWVTLLSGEAGFVSSPDAQSLTVAATPGAGDALHGALSADADVGFLGIEFATRRRNRVNGRVTAAGADGIVVAVTQSFGNCPQYIHEREWQRIAPTNAGRPVATPRLLASHQAWIAAADTLFIGSGYARDGRSPNIGMDASHRGGDPGFVQVIDNQRLVFPDFAGNNHFNTIGNLVLDPRAALTFVDFHTGSMLQLTGRASIDWDSEAVAAVPGAGRLVEFEVEAVVELPGTLPLRWRAPTGSVRSLRLVDKVSESDDVTSFVLASRDGGPLAAFEAGQHLPLDLRVPGVAEPVRRTYSLSNAPGVDTYRITVKREPHGTASRHLHDHLAPGAVVDARAPAGEFVLPCSECPVVLVSAGVGVTPMVSLLHVLANEGGERPVWFVHGARDGTHHPLADEVRALAASRRGIHLHVAYSQPGSEDVAGVHYDSHGRIDGALLGDLVQRPDARYLLCGPTSFMAGVQQALERNGVGPERIHAESFGPAAATGPR